MLSIASLNLKVMLITQIYTMYPWREDTIRLSVFSLMITQETISMNEVHETSLIILRLKTEITISNLLISWDKDSIIIETITIHIICGHSRILVATTPCLVSKIQVITTLVVHCSRSDKTVRSNISCIVQLHCCRTIYCCYIIKYRRGIRTW